MDLLKDSMGGSFFLYDGSVTTPNCTEQTKWVVIPNVQGLSEDQFTFFSNKWRSDTAKFGNGNARAIQDINNRRIYMLEWEAISTLSS
mmetsp:Transcript_18711/g.17821  ORF Transcript_18711/g.17821 Transcript_18711/m.17821 type:complete len:88 (-) Transcript_18711:109-372(-)